MRGLVKVDRFFGIKSQPLRNVPVVAPSIIAVTSGIKTLLWQGDTLTFNRSNWLLASSNEKLTFVNEPFQKQFNSVQISFLSSPSEHILQQSITAGKETDSMLASPCIEVTDGLNFAFSQLLSMSEHHLSQSVQQLYLDAFYQQLSEAGGLPSLFGHHQLTLRDKVSRYVAADPARNHSIDNVCGHFAMSQATFMRHLSKEHTSFRVILAEVRMLHAIGVMQSSYSRNGTQLSQLELAICCGYQSETRFSQRFKHQFGISLKEYKQTLNE